MDIKEILKVRKLHPDAKLPTRAYDKAAGYDLYALENNDIPNDGKNHPVKTGIAITPPEGWYGKISEKSGLALKHSIHIGGGICDEDYIGEYIILISYYGDYSEHQIRAGEKIAQVVFHRYGDFDIVETTSLADTSRGDKGFGSSGA